MTDSQELMTLQELLDFARSHGYEVKRHNLNRWKHWRLLPGPEDKPGHGRKTGGSTAYYSRKAGEQLVELCRWRAEHPRDKDAWAVGLWLQAFPIGDSRVEESVKPMLVEHLRELYGNAVQAFRRYVMEEPGNPLAALDQGEVPPEVEKVAEVLDRRSAGTLGELAARITAFAAKPGHFDPKELVARDPELFEAAVEGLGEQFGADLFSDLKGKTRREAVEDWLTDVARILNPDYLLGTLESLSTDELNELRDQARAIFELWRPTEAVERAPPPIESILLTFVVDQTPLRFDQLVRFFLTDAEWRAMGLKLVSLVVTGSDDSQE